MARPAKTAAMLQDSNDISHRSKKEIASRARAEADLLTGKAMKEFPEVKAIPAAHKEFTRLRNLLRQIGKDDDLYSNAINRYARLHAECIEHQAIRDAAVQELLHVGLDDLDRVDALTKIQAQHDRQLMERRKAMFSIEKENLLTVASALRSVPKKPESTANPLLEALADDG